MIYTLPPAWPKLQLLSRELIFRTAVIFPGFRGITLGRSVEGEKALSHPFTFQLGFLRGNDTVTALAPSFLSGGRSTPASAHCTSSPPYAPLAPVCQRSCSWGLSPKGSRLLLREGAVAAEAGDREAGKTGCAQVV